ncbi:39S ribosomal protein L12, mitochondrial-like [Xenia sp. Carnegie-2017]|uniref:39S ribosomal protein L12, mitochondrial-like n=1 Tax=Xenia sp. Carnegie-2017 TaxID=2897299 RepID=UPI001F04160B|nr:39S ribosomal protein L12, mitochondrial-like [Xenia sp. Carnegie-2017]
MAAIRRVNISRISKNLFAAYLPSRNLSAIQIQKEVEYNEGENEKHYPPHIVNIVEQISQLTLVETAELNELLKVKLKIPDAPMMAMGATSMAPSADKIEAAEEQEEQTEFTVKLTAFSADGKVKLIKEIKNIVEGLNLVEAKKFVEGVPQVVKENISKEDADKLKKQLEAIGGTVVVE